MGNGIQGVWGTWPMRPTEAKWYRCYGVIGHRDTGGNGVQVVWGIWAMRPTGGMGYRGIWGTWAIQAQGVWVQGVWATSAIGHMANGAHGQWGSWAPWAMGPMGNLDIFAHNIINTGWILTKNFTGHRY